MDHASITKGAKVRIDSSHQKHGGKIGTVVSPAKQMSAVMIDGEDTKIRLHNKFILLNRSSSASVLRSTPNGTPADETPSRASSSSAPNTPPSRAPLTISLLFMSLACLIPVVIADDKPPGRVMVCESMLGAAFGAGVATFAQANNMLPHRLAAHFAVPHTGAIGGAVFGAAMPSLLRAGFRSLAKIAARRDSPPAMVLPLPPSDPAYQIVQGWLKTWERSRKGNPDRATPLSLIGDSAVHGMAGNLSAQVRRGLGDDAVLELEVGKCDGSGGCTDQLEGFMLRNSLAKRPGLIVLANATFNDAPESNARRFRDSIGVLEVYLGPTAKGGVKATDLAACPAGKKCKIIASLFAFLTTAAYLDADGCVEKRATATSPNTMQTIAAEERQQKIWAPTRFSHLVANWQPATHARWGSSAALVCESGPEI